MVGDGVGDQFVLRRGLLVNEGCDDLSCEISLQELDLVFWVVCDGHQRGDLLRLIVHQIDDIFFNHSNFVVALE